MKKGIIIFFILFSSIVIIKLMRPTDVKYEKNIVKHQSFLQYPLTAGLPDVLRGINSKLKKKSSDNLMYLIIKSPDYKLNYGSPRMLTKSLLKNKLSNLNVGHMQVAWSCRIKNKLYESATGFTGDSANISYELIKNGAGISPLVITFLDGRLESPAEVNSNIIQSTKNDKMTILAIKVGSSCQAILKDFWSFVNSPTSNYFTVGSLDGNDNDTGGENCSSFAIGFFNSHKKIYNYLVEGSLKRLRLQKELFGNIKLAGIANKIVVPMFLKKNNRKISSLISFPKFWPKKGINVELYDVSRLADYISNSDFETVDYKYKGNKFKMSIFR